MSTRIKTALVRMEPVLAELHLHIEPDPASQSDCLMRFLGPSCLYASTVEIAYPVHPLGRPGEYRILLPEPSYWDPASPFLYDLVFQSHQGGKRLYPHHFPLPLRRFQVMGERFRLNGQDLRLVGRRPESTDVESLEALRKEGCNALLLADELDRNLILEATRRGFLCFRSRSSPQGDLAEGPLLGPGDLVVFSWPFGPD